jgi:hypothetical protein
VGKALLMETEVTGMFNAGNGSWCTRRCYETSLEDLLAILVHEVFIIAFSV